MYRVIVIFISLFFSFSVAFAQTTSTTTQSTTTLATTQEITAADLSVPDPSFWEISKRKFARFFTLSQIKKSRLSLELANLTLLQAKKASQSGDQTKAATLIDSYNQQIGSASDSLNQITNQYKDIDDPDLQAILSKIENTRLLEVSLLDSLNLKATGELNKKITEVRSEALKDLTEILTKKNLSQDELTKKINEISKKLESKELKAEEKYAKKMDILDDLDEESSDKRLDDAIVEVEKDELDEISKESSDVLAKVTDKISKRKDIIVLQELLTRVPDSAKPAIQAKIDRELSKITSELKNDPKALEQIIKEDEKNIEAKKKVMEGIKKSNEKASESVKKEIEKKNEEVKKIEEGAKKEIEKKQEDAKKAEEAAKQVEEKRNEEIKKAEENAKKELEESGN